MRIENLSKAPDFVKSIGRSRSRARASYPSCVTAYPRGSRSRVL